MGKPKIALEQYSNSVSVKVNAIRSFLMSSLFHQEAEKTHRHSLTAIPNRSS